MQHDIRHLTLDPVMLQTVALVCRSEIGAAMVTSLIEHGFTVSHAPSPDRRAGGYFDAADRDIGVCGDAADLPRNGAAIVYEAAHAWQQVCGHRRLESRLPPEERMAAMMLTEAEAHTLQLLFAIDLAERGEWSVYECLNRGRVYPAVLATLCEARARGADWGQLLRVGMGALLETRELGEQCAEISARRWQQALQDQGGGCGDQAAEGSATSPSFEAFVERMERSLTVGPLDNEHFRRLVRQAQDRVQESRLADPVVALVRPHMLTAQRPALTLGR